LTRQDAEKIGQKIIALAKKREPQIIRILLDRMDRDIRSPLAIAASQAGVASNDPSIRICVSE
jgi:hypothetical protein